jgi:hypothetical protein
MKTNIEELKLHLKKVFGEMTQTKEFEEFAYKAGDAIKDSVIRKTKTNGQYNYIQSGRLLRTLRTNEPELQVNKTGSKAVIGYGYIDDFNQQTKRGPQKAVFKQFNGDEIKIGLRPEPSLPNWIIAEFGRRAGTGAAPTGIPQEFLVPYAARDQEKKFMVGPSISFHNRKPVFFMANFSNTSRSSAMNGLGLKTHPGIHEGRMFRDGLREAQEKINLNLGEALYHSLESLASKYGGEVHRT